MTIYALSSGAGTAGIAVIRVSGENTSKVIKDGLAKGADRGLFIKNDSDPMKYLSKRGISKDTISEFQIGYVPSNSDFYNHLLKQNEL